ncbi:amidase [Mesorhizobium sp. VK23B]|uniref:Indoleacetamide hydrolase n=2 Tax=Mesorhizobium dulcispinae TaxID=3072316 RepID=A0ABU4XBD8_9HYPH|nr:amidase [Mesorhizobium sp. VK23A]MDX8464694.1 amidase [Mesorhizobium sp. VK23B]MDX8471080.1 amidase [Mesorhizobium sp. VK23A]
MAQLARGAVTPSLLAERALARAGECAGLNAFVALDAAHVLRQAAEADARRSRGSPASPIDGVPIAVKDNYLTIDYPTTACSRALPLEPAGVDATIVANLRRAGAIIFGKTNMHEWAYGATNATSSFGPTRNPRNPDHITGGSSGGSGAAVAAGVVAAALGSDTGGSVRIPSGACGIYGFKPSYGRASRHGVLPLSWSLDAPGLLAAALEDILLLLPYFLGADACDPTTARSRPLEPIPDLDAPRVLNLVGNGLERSAEVDQVMSTALIRTGLDVTDREVEGAAAYFAAWEAILHCEASSYHGAQLDRDPSGYSPVTRAHLEAGRMLTGVDLLKAQKLRGQLMAHLDGLGDWDALVLPTLPVVAPLIGDEWQSFGGRKVTTQDSMTWFCWIGNLAGLPCISIPCGASSNGLPVGMMLMGRPGADEHLLAVARRVDRRINMGA